jgi:hypothetical protein
MTGILFLIFVVLTASAAMALAVRYCRRRVAYAVLTTLPLWLCYVGSMSYFGVIGNTTLRLPGIVYILLPVFVFVFFVLIRSSAGARLALSFPVWTILALQVFRVGVELFLHQLWRQGLVPKMLTFEGANVDILIGLSAPLAAWISTRGRAGTQLALIWNWFGLLCLTNTALRFAMTAPGPMSILHSEVPNLAAGTFPYSFIPGFFAPLAVILHVLAIRSLRSRLNAGGENTITPNKEATS